jgi:hypothetical protein
VISKGNHLVSRNDAIGVQHWGATLGGSVPQVTHSTSNAHTHTRQRHAFTHAQTNTHTHTHLSLTSVILTVLTVLGEKGEGGS